MAAALKSRHLQPMVGMLVRIPGKGVNVMVGRAETAVSRRGLLSGRGVVDTGRSEDVPRPGVVVECVSAADWYERVGVAVGDRSDESVYMWRGLLSWAGDRAAARAGDVPGVGW